MLIDGGMMFRIYRLAQLAADAAAHAAAQELDTDLYLRTGRVALTPEAAQVAQDLVARNTHGQVTCGRPHIWAERVELVCRAHLRPVVLFRETTIEVAVRGRARPAWGISEEGE